MILGVCFGYAWGMIGVVLLGLYDWGGTMGVVRLGWYDWGGTLGVYLGYFFKNVLNSWSGIELVFNLVFTNISY